MKYDEALKLVKNMQIAKECEMVKTLDLRATLIKALEDVQAYRAIGTVEECRNAVEKMKPKKPIDKSKNPIDWHVMACPSCEHVFWNSGQFVHYEPKFCNYCGQKLDWSE